MSTGTLTDDEWEDIIVRLTAFTRSWTRGKPWFRGEKTTTFLMGKEIEDYVFAAIGRYLEHPENFDPEQGELLEYLKIHRIPYYHRLNEVDDPEIATVIMVYDTDSYQYFSEQIKNSCAYKEIYLTMC